MPECTTGHLTHSDVSETCVGCQRGHDCNQALFLFVDHFGSHASRLVAKDVNLLFELVGKTVGYERGKGFCRAIGSHSRDWLYGSD